MAQIYCRTLINEFTGSMESGAAEANYPITNINNGYPDSCFRSTNKTDIIIQISKDATNITPTFLAIINHNLAAGTTLVLKAHTSDAIGAATTLGTLTIPANPSYHKTAWLTFTNASAFDYFWLDLTSSTSADAYFEFGEIILGAHVTFSQNFGAIKEVLHFPTNFEKTKSGRSKRTIYDGGFRSFELVWDNCDTTTKEQIEALLLAVSGSYESFALVIDTVESSSINRNCYYGFISQEEIIIEHISSLIYNISFSFEEETLG